MNIELAAKTYHLNNSDVTSIDCFKAGAEYALKELQKQPSSIVSDGDISVDLDTFLLSYNGESKIVPRKILQMIHLFISNKGRVLSRKKILDSIWGTDIIVGERTIDVHIRKIKIALFEDCIESYKGIGYKWK